MSEKLKAVNVVMKGIGRKDANEAYAKLKFQLTRSVVEAFDWPDVPSVSEWTPEAPNDNFRCHFIEIKPNNPELGNHALRIEAATIGDFQIQKKAKKEGANSVKAEKVIVDVACTVRFTIPTALATLESFKVHANKNSEMLIAYDRAPQQGELEGTRVDVVSGEVIDGRRPLIPEVFATAEQQDAVTDAEAETGMAPTHFEKLQERKEEAKKKRAAKEAIQ